MPRFGRFVRSFARREEGATMVEYALLVVTIVLVASVGALVLGGKLNSRFSNVGPCVTQAGTSTTDCSAAASGGKKN